MGRKTKLKIIGRAYDEKGDALLVEDIKSENKYPHITLSCAEGVKPVYSHELIERASEDGSIDYFSSPKEIEVIEGYSDGKNDFMSGPNKF